MPVVDAVIGRLNGFSAWIVDLSGSGVGNEKTEKWRVGVICEGGKL
jgi:hypothetical protein